MTEPLRIVAGDRRQGKTTRLVDWLQQGERIDRYPGRSRILLTSHEREAQRVRKEFALDYHQVYSLRDWTHRYRQGFSQGLEVAIDDAELILRETVGNQRLAIISTTGRSTW